MAAIYWHTEADNVPARRLYDRVARLIGYVRYDISLPCRRSRILRLPG